MPLLVIMGLMGWKKAEMNNRYAHLRTDDKRQGVAVLAGLGLESQQTTQQSADAA